jgi:hypothetical protein
MRASGEESLLMKAVGSETYEATFTDAQGQEVTVMAISAGNSEAITCYINFSNVGEKF